MKKENNKKKKSVEHKTIYQNQHKNKQHNITI